MGLCQPVWHRQIVRLLAVVWEDTELLDGGGVNADEMQRSGPR